MTIRVVGTRVYVGPNIFAQQPLIHVKVDLGDLRDRPAAAIDPGFADRLLAVLPGLAGHPGVGGAAGGFEPHLRDPQGARLGRIAARVAVELQCLAGHPVSVGGDRTIGSGGVEDILYGYREVDLGVAAGETAMTLLVALLPELLGGLVEGDRPVPTEPAALRDRFLAIAADTVLDQTTLALIDAAERRGIPWFRIDRRSRYVQLGQGCRMHRIHESLTDATPVVASWLAMDKVASGALFARAGLPVPRQLTARSADAAVRAAEEIGYPVVVKPSDGRKGRGVRVGLKDAEAVRHAVEAASAFGPEVIVESVVEGVDNRLLVVGGRMVAAAQRIPGGVVGDGERSVEELVAEANRDPRRGTAFTKLMNLLEWDDEADALLAEKGYGRASVPAAGERVDLRRTANISTGGTAVDVSERVHPDNRRLAERAARLIGLDVAGVDFITPDIAVSHRRGVGAINEINASPGLRPHILADPQRDVVGPIIDLMFPDGSAGRVPIAAVTGTNGKTTTVRMLAHILAASGRTVGRATSQGAVVGDETVLDGDAGGVPGARAVLDDRRTEIAVLETPRQGILRHGLAFDACAVAAVLNVGNDHLLQDGIGTIAQIAGIQQVAVQAARDLAVLNADDDRCLAMRNQSGARRVCLLTRRPDHPAVREHLAGGGMALTLGWHGGADGIAIHDGETVHPLMAAAEIPATLGGRAGHNVENAMAAAAMALGLGLPAETVRERLAAFDASAALSPGRLNLYDGHPFTVLVDAAHNPTGADALRALVDSMAVDGRRLLAFGMPGDRPNSLVDETARRLAGGFDHYVVSDRDDRGGRPAGEVPDRLRAALLDAGVPDRAITVLDREENAVAATLQGARAGDLVVLLVADHGRTWSQVSGGDADLTGPAD